VVVAPKFELILKILKSSESWFRQNATSVGKMCECLPMLR
jgi:hypothetical protein